MALRLMLALYLAVVIALTQGNTNIIGSWNLFGSLTPTNNAVPSSGFQYFLNTPSPTQPPTQAILAPFARDRTKTSLSGATVVQFSASKPTHRASTSFSAASPQTGPSKAQVDALNAIKNAFPSSQRMILIDKDMGQIQIQPGAFTDKVVIKNPARAIQYSRPYSVSHKALKAWQPPSSTLPPPTVPLQQPQQTFVKSARIVKPRFQFTIADGIQVKRGKLDDVFLTGKWNLPAPDLHSSTHPNYLGQTSNTPFHFQELEKHGKRSENKSRSRYTNKDTVAHYKGHLISPAHIEKYNTYYNTYDIMLNSPSVNENSFFSLRRTKRQSRPHQAHGDIHTILKGNASVINQFAKENREVNQKRIEKLKSERKTNRKSKKSKRKRKKRRKSKKKSKKENSKRKTKTSNKLDNNKKGDHVKESRAEYSKGNRTKRKDKQSDKTDPENKLKRTDQIAHTKSNKTDSSKGKEKRNKVDDIKMQGGTNVNGAGVRLQNIDLDRNSQSKRRGKQMKGGMKQKGKSRDNKNEKTKLQQNNSNKKNRSKRKQNKQSFLNSQLQHNLHVDQKRKEKRNIRRRNHHATEIINDKHSKIDKENKLNNTSKQERRERRDRRRNHLAIGESDRIKYLKNNGIGNTSRRNNHSKLNQSSLKVDKTEFESSPPGKAETKTLKDLNESVSDFPSSFENGSRGKGPHPEKTGKWKPPSNEKLINKSSSAQPENEFMKGSNSTDPPNNPKTSTMPNLTRNPPSIAKEVELPNRNDMLNKLNPKTPERTDIFNNLEPGTPNKIYKSKSNRPDKFIPPNYEGNPTSQRGQHATKVKSGPRNIFIIIPSRKSDNSRSKGTGIRHFSSNDRARHKYIDRMIRKGHEMMKGLHFPSKNQRGSFQLRRNQIFPRRRSRQNVNRNGKLSRRRERSRQNRSKPPFRHIEKRMAILDTSLKRRLNDEDVHLVPHFKNNKTNTTQNNFSHLNSNMITHQPVASVKDLSQFIDNSWNDTTVGNNIVQEKEKNNVHSYNSKDLNKISQSSSHIKQANVNVRVSGSRTKDRGYLVMLFDNEHLLTKPFNPFLKNTNQRKSKPRRNFDFVLQSRYTGNSYTGPNNKRLKDFKKSKQQKSATSNNLSTDLKIRSINSLTIDKDTRHLNKTDTPGIVKKTNSDSENTLYTIGDEQYNKGNDKNTEKILLSADTKRYDGSKGSGIRDNFDLAKYKFLEFSKLKLKRPTDKYAETHRSLNTTTRLKNPASFGNSWFLNKSQISFKHSGDNKRFFARTMNDLFDSSLIGNTFPKESKESKLLLRLLISNQIPVVQNIKLRRLTHDQENTTQNSQTNNHSPSNIRNKDHKSYTINKHIEEKDNEKNTDKQVLNDLEFLSYFKQKATPSKKYNFNDSKKRKLSANAISRNNTGYLNDTIVKSINSENMNVVQWFKQNATTDHDASTAPSSDLKKQAIISRLQDSHTKLNIIENRTSTGILLSMLKAPKPGKVKGYSESSKQTKNESLQLSKSGVKSFAHNDSKTKPKYAVINLMKYLNTGKPKKRKARAIVNLPIQNIIGDVKGHIGRNQFELAYKDTGVRGNGIVGKGYNTVNKATLLTQSSNKFTDYYSPTVLTSSQNNKTNLVGTEITRTRSRINSSLYSKAPSPVTAQAPGGHANHPPPNYGPPPGPIYPVNHAPAHHPPVNHAPAQHPPAHHPPPQQPLWNQRVTPPHRYPTHPPTHPPMFNPPPRHYFPPRTYPTPAPYRPRPTTRRPPRTTRKPTTTTTTTTTTTSKPEVEYDMEGPRTTQAPPVSRTRPTLRPKCDYWSLDRFGSLQFYPCQKPIFVAPPTTTPAPAPPVFFFYDVATPDPDPWGWNYDYPSNVKIEVKVKKEERTKK